MYVYTYVIIRVYIYIYIIIYTHIHMHIIYTIHTSTMRGRSGFNIRICADILYWFVLRR